ncbi:MAG: hypothetical protein JWN98_1757, partial [Abditibacteriota bacterium]|nr:hypothetical protein [Abditibacteriota bacterium]
SLKAQLCPEVSYFHISCCAHTTALWGVVSLALLLSSGCASRNSSPLPTGKSPSPTAKTTPTIQTSPATGPSVSSPLRFTDVTQQAGIRWKHNSGASGLKLMPETMGSGVTWIDFDGDGDQDLFFVNGRHWTALEIEEYRKGQWSEDEKTVFRRTHPPGTALRRVVPTSLPTQRTTSALYRNNRDGTFTDITRGSGLDVEMQGMGAAVGDYDNDGRNDLLVTSVGRNYLFRNQSTLKVPRFLEVAQQAGVRANGWSTSAAWLDYDKDGLLDLFVCRYVKWTPALDRYGTMNGRDKSYTAPFFYNGEKNLLFRNQGKGRFRDVSQRAGIALSRLKGMALGVAVCDVNSDGWLDLIVANDSEPNVLYQNNKDGTFTEAAQRAGIALDNSGNDRGGMGIDTADVDHSNRDSAIIGNFDAEMMGYYYNQGKGVFADIGPATAIGQASKTYSIFGCVFLDGDNDTWPDIMTASGHIDPQIDGIRGTFYALRPLLFQNFGRGEFQEVGSVAGEAFNLPRVGRGLACADYDLDGDVDVVMTTNNGAPVLWRNDVAEPAASHRSIRIELRGSQSNRSAIGTLIKVKTGADVQRLWVRSGSSYLSQNELPITVGLGKADSADSAVRWPSGKVTVLKNLDANKLYVVDEVKGSVKQQLLPRRKPH